MSDYGLRVIKKNGNIQIDGQYRNHSLFQTKTVNKTDSNLVYQATFADLAATSDIPIVSYRLTATLLMLDQVGKSFGFPPPWNQIKLRNPSGAHYEFNYQIWRPGINQTASSYGLKVLNASGNTVFHSDDAHLTIVSSNTATLGHGSGDGSQASVLIPVKDATNNYFILYPEVGYWWQENPPNGVRETFRGAKKHDSTTVKVQTWFRDYEVGPISTLSTWVATLTLIEVEKG